jgi:conjugal transfer pilin signal peptidase TrbI
MQKLSGLNVFIAIFALVFAGALSASRFSVTLTPSLIHRVFFLSKSPDAIEKGDYILFDIPVPGIRERAIKEAACSGGDYLETRVRQFFCNGEFLGEAKEYSLAGERLIQFAYSGEIPEGRIFVFGQNRDSYDSRYFGFIKEEDVQARAYPLY